MAAKRFIDTTRIAMKSVFAVSTMTILMLANGILAADGPIDADLVLKGGTIFDGSGSPGVVGDVAIRSEKIIGVGQLKLGQVERTIDCSGLYVTPGFIDLHTHSDEQVIAPTLRACVNYVIQGCTTSVTGNCGSGPTDVAEFYAKIDAAGAGTNVAHLLPQGSLRDRVLGSVERKATDEELTKMRDLADKAMRDGAWGMSTGLIYVPSVYASTDELIELAKVVASHGGIYASHIRGEGRELLTAVNEAMQIGESAKLPVHISHFKASGSENWGTIRQAVALIETARRKGRAITADQYPYTASSTSLEATLIPTWARSGGNKELFKRMDDPETGSRIRDAVQRDIDRAADGAALFIARYKPRPDWVGKHLKQIADEETRPAIDIACEVFRNGGAAIVNFSMSEEDVRFAMQLPWVSTASDGRSYLPNSDRPHPRNYGTFARKIGRYAIREKVMPVEQAIRSASGLPSDILGLKDRGYLKEGLAADIAVFDPAKYIDEATFAEPHHYASGIRYVFVNGVPAVHEGQPTGALAGRSLKRREAAN
jgi:N-acyl-D-amino-acid deacylase